MEVGVRIVQGGGQLCYNTRELHNGRNGEGAPSPDRGIGARRPAATGSAELCHSRRCCILDLLRNLIRGLGFLILAPLIALPAPAAQSPGPSSRTGPGIPGPLVAPDRTGLALLVLRDPGHSRGPRRPLAEDSPPRPGNPAGRPAGGRRGPHRPAGETCSRNRPGWSNRSGSGAGSRTISRILKIVLAIVTELGRPGLGTDPTGRPEAVRRARGRPRARPCGRSGDPGGRSS